MTNFYPEDGSSRFLRNRYLDTSYTALYLVRPEHCDSLKSNNDKEVLNKETGSDDVLWRCSKQRLQITRHLVGPSVTATSGKWSVANSTTVSTVSSEDGCRNSAIHFTLFRPQNANSLYSTEVYVNLNQNTHFMFNNFFPPLKMAPFMT
jgi:hypothetical protein